MKIKTESLYNIYFLFVISYFFTYYMYGLQWQLIILFTFILLVIFMSTKKKFVISFSDCLLILLGLLYFLSSLISPSLYYGLAFSITVFCAILSCIVIRQSEYKNFKFVFKLIFIFSFIHTFASIIYYFFPNIIQSILPYILKPADLTNNLYEFNYNGIICGITPIQGINAIYISMFLMIVFCSLFFNNTKKIFNIILLFLGYFALFLSSKRGLLLANIIAMFFVYFFFKYKHKQITLKSIFKICFVTLFSCLILFSILYNYFPDSLEIFERFKQKDFLTGRGDIWNIGWNNYIKNSLFLGTGLFSSRELLFTTLGSFNDLHNIYLQFLIETGILGFSVLIFNIINIIRKFVRVKLDSKNLFAVLLSLYYFIVMFIYGFTGNWLFDVTMVFMFFIVLSIFLSFILKRGDY